MHRTSRVRRASALALALLCAAAPALLCALAGCTQHARVICEPLGLASDGEYALAAAAIDETKIAGSGNDRFLHHAQRGHLLHLAGEYEASNSAFEAAVAAAEELEPWSLSETVTDYTFNETVKAYAGEDFERAYLHYYMALNYLALDDLEGALVECRRLDEVFRELDARYEEDTGRYQDDGFIRYLSALVYEAMGKSDDARIDFELAARAYEGEVGKGAGMGVPSGLEASLPERSEGGGGTAEIVVLIDSGWAPYKREESIEVPIFREHVPREYWEHPDLAAVVKIAYPVFESVDPAPSDFAVRAVGMTGVSAVPNQEAVDPGGPNDQPPTATSFAERVQDVDALARWTLDRRMAAIVARSGIRATLKTVAMLGAGEDDDDDEGDRGRRRRDDGGFWSWFAGFLVDHIVPIAVAETEQADTRSWVLLPAEVWMARVPVEPGAYEVLVRPEGEAPITLGIVEVPPGGKAFRSCRVFGRPHPMRCD